MHLNYHLPNCLQQIKADHKLNEKTTTFFSWAHKSYVEEIKIGQGKLVPLVVEINVDNICFLITHLGWPQKKKTIVSSLKSAIWDIADSRNNVSCGS